MSYKNFYVDQLRMRVCITYVRLRNNYHLYFGEL